MPDEEEDCGGATAGAVACCLKRHRVARLGLHDPRKLELEDSSYSPRPLVKCFVKNTPCSFGAGPVYRVVGSGTSKAIVDDPAISDYEMVSSVAWDAEMQAEDELTVLILED